jgi:hypothetical protein
MAMDPVKMLANWNDKVIPARIQEDFTARLPSMTARFQNWTVLQAMIVNKVKAILASTSATACDVAKYCAFAMRLAGLASRHVGIQLNDEVALEVAKWKSRGCIEAALINIRDAVFGIPAPAAP